MRADDGGKEQGYDFEIDINVHIFEQKQLYEKS